MAKKKTKETSESSKKKKEVLSEFDITIDLINKEKGDLILRSLDDEVETHGLSGGLSSGSLGFDYAINPKKGGMSWGQLLQLYGKRSGGKTTLALGFCANCTALKKNVLYLDLEGTMDTDMVRRAGVDPAYFHFVEEDGVEAALIIERVMRSGNLGLVVIDSLAVWEPEIVPKKNSKKDTMVDFTAGKIAHQGSFVTTVIKKLCRTAKKTGTVILSINQVRNTLDIYSGEAKIVPYGPHALDHAVSVQCLVKGKPRGEKVITDQSGELIGQYTEILVDKNKTAIPMQKAEVPLIFGVGTNPYMEIAVLAQQWGIIALSGSWFKWVGTGENIVQGLAGLTTLLANDQVFYEDLRDKVIKEMGLVYDKKPINAYHHPLLKGRDPELKMLKPDDE